ncbi:hypothetical protein DV701_04260 [Ornithinimicrobium avium]|uniref:Uncharacterized protein n=1 Tax=Ornithinimicrobium avium TaxID=2283195 RepID=A0A345NK87_9MICO|nr:hypothetical protein DV701_04260 [Ornithinimicrobium avium]
MEELPSSFTTTPSPIWSARARHCCTKRDALTHGALREGDERSNQAWSSLLVTSRGRTKGVRGRSDSSQKRSALLAAFQVDSLSSASSCAATSGGTTVSPVGTSGSQTSRAACRSCTRSALRSGEERAILPVARRNLQNVSRVASTV